jgi:7-carboxy-7-deazaguanine synthase
MSERPLYVAEVFGPVFQGEGPSAGQRAGFVRLGGCNLACTWCDTAYTWDARRYDLRAEIGPQSVAQLLAALDAMAVPLVVITGGEPLLQTRALTPLVAALSTRGLRVEVETNGTRPPPGWPWAGITFNVSPKLAHSGNAAARAALAPGWAADPRARFKFVCRTAADLDAVAAYGLPAGRLWVMPEGQQSRAVRARLRWLAPQALARGWAVTDRLHVHVWGAARGH